MTYEEARTFLDSCNQYAGEFTLEPLKGMLEKLGNPERQLSFVHIAGTNGKGSVLAFVSTALKEAGYRVGRYISPTIFSYRERIQVNEAYIPREDLARLTERICAAGQELLAEGKRHPTTFEAETALAFLWFAEQCCDLVVLEVGRGGLKDATNVIENTLVAALASISMDHMEFLGSTLGAIAEQKAGIIKPGCTVVSAAQQPEAAEVIERESAAFEAPLVWVQPDEIRNRRRGLLRQSFNYRERTDIEISLCGEYQFENAALALEVLDALCEKGYKIPEEAVRRGFRSTVWQGRFTVLKEKPLFLMDGAHNRDAAARLRESIVNYLPEKRLIFIIGVLKDKEYGELLRQTAPLAAEILTITPPDNPRALPAAELAREAGKYCSDVCVAESIREAVDTALSLAGEEDVILAFGSLSWLGKLAREVGLEAGMTAVEKWKETGKYNNFDLHFHFDRKRESVTFLNAEYIHPLKQDLLQELQTDFEEDQNVRAVIVFGSSVEFRCNSCSDLDLCIERSDSSRFFHCKSVEPGEKIDIIYADRMGERLRQEVEKKGIVVFDREGIYV